MGTPGKGDHAHWDHLGEEALCTGTMWEGSAKLWDHLGEEALHTGTPRSETLHNRTPGRQGSVHWDQLGEKALHTGIM